jgi:hypothetical protein
MSETRQPRIIGRLARDHNLFEPAGHAALRGAIK